MRIGPARVRTSRLTVSEQPCNAVFSILANVQKGLKLPALDESSSISAQASLGVGGHENMWFCVQAMLVLLTS